MNTIYKPISDEIEKLRREHLILTNDNKILENKITVMGEHIVNLEKRIDEELVDIKKDLDILKSKTLLDTE